MLTFTEIQLFRGRGAMLIFSLLSVMAGVFIYGGIQQIILGRPFGDKPTPDVVLLCIILLNLFLIFLLYRAKLETRISEEGIFFRWTPFIRQFRQYRWDDIEKVDIFKYGFAGYGWRLTPYGTLFSAGGNTGLRIFFKSGKKVILGTQKPEELTRFLRQMKILP